MKVYAVYSIPKSPEYRLEKLTKEGAKGYIKGEKIGDLARSPWERNNCIYDIQIEEIEE